MVKKGPCSHCGINSTPLWRNGPADKPVLCNACGSRYKVKGHLDDDYLPKNVQYVKNIKNLHGHGASESHLNVEDQLPNHVPPTGNGSSSSNISTPDDHPISTKDFGPKAPSRKRSRVEYRQQMTPMEEFHKQLLDLYKRDQMEGKAPYPDDDLVDNVNNFIPYNEVGLGAILLKTDDHDVASTDHPGSLTSSSTDNHAQCDQSSTTAPAPDH